MHVAHIDIIFICPRAPIVNIGEKQKMTPPISNNKHKKQTNKNKKLLRLMSGYDQHTSPSRLLLYNQIFSLPKTTLKTPCLGHSKRPI